MAMQKEMVLSFLLFSGGAAFGGVVLRSDFETSSVRPTANPQIDVVDVTDSGGQSVDVPIWYEAGTASDRSVAVVDDPTLPGNKVLHYRIKNAVVPAGGQGQFKARIQTQFRPPAPTVVYERFRLYLHPDVALYRAYPQSNNWFMVSETRAGAQNTDPYVFRITLNIVKLAGAGEPLHFSVAGDTRTGGSSGQGTWANLWGLFHPQFDVPTGKWMNVEIGYRSGDASTGRFYLAVQPEGDPTKTVLFDHTNWTYHPGAPGPVPFSNTQPLKLYTSDDIVNFIGNNGGTVQIYWDDFEVLDQWPASPPASPVNLRVK
jgi:hypothetical protein